MKASAKANCVSGPISVPGEVDVSKEEDPNLVTSLFQFVGFIAILTSIQVTWSKPSDPSNPHSWSLRRRLLLAALLSFVVALPPISSTMLAPASSILFTELNITSTTRLQLVFSIYNLGYGLGPLLLASFSELHGRLPILHLCTASFLIFNTAAGFAQTTVQLASLRFFSAFAGSTTMSIGSGILGDSFALHEFGTAAAVYGLAPMLGPIIGPVAGGFMAQYLSWRWMCWVLSLVGIPLQVMALFFLRETHAPTILWKKKTVLARETGNQHLYTVHDRDDRRSAWIRRSMRPLELLATQPLVQALGFYIAFLTGVCYTIMYTFSNLWREEYGQSIAVSSLNYISLGVGYVIGVLGCSYLNNRIYKALSVRNGGLGKPEFRLPVALLGAILAPFGLFWYGWTAQAKAKWVLPDIGIAIYGGAFVIGIANTHIYVVDYYGSHAASAIAAVSFLQALFGFVLPLFGPALYHALGYGWGNSLVGFIAIGVGWPLPALLWRYGGAIQKRSPYSARDQPIAAGER